jgi:lysophospholipase L1-like esterase
LLLIPLLLELPPMLVRPRTIVGAYLIGCALWGASLGLFVGASTSRASVAPRHLPSPGEVHARSRLGEEVWKRRHEAICEQARKGEADVVFLGDSITHGWKYVPEWQQRFARYDALNAGISSDRVEHLLWRVRNGNLDKVKPKAAVLLIGVNNLAVSSPDEIAAGVRQVIAEIHQRSPRTEVLLLGLFPTGKERDHPRRAKIAAVNHKLAPLGKLDGVDFLDIGDKFLEKDGSLSKDIMPDYLHLSARGYRIWADAIEPRLARMVRGS